MCLGIPGQIVEILDAKQHLAKIEVAGVKRPINITCIIEPETVAEDYVGEWVLVHVGFAMSVIDPQEAQKTLDILAQLGEIEEAEQSLLESAPYAANPPAKVGR